MKVGELHANLGKRIAHDKRIADIPIHIENSVDDSQAIGVIADDLDPWDEVDDLPDDMPARLVITANDGHRWMGSPKGRKANAGPRRHRLRDRRIAISLITAHVIANHQDASMNVLNAYVDELITRYIAKAP